MKLIPSTTSQMALMLVGFAGLSSALMVWLIPAPQSKITAEVQDIAWQLPHPAATHPQASFDKLRQLQAWGKDAEVAEAVATATNSTAATTQSKEQPITWKLVGTVTQGQKRFMLSVDAADKEQKVKRYQEAATLPDGTILMSVEGDYIQIRDKQEEYKILRLYQPPAEKTK